MAEAIGLVASLIAIVEMSAKITQLCKHYIQHVKDTRADLRKVLLETTSLGAFIENLQFLFVHDPDFEGSELVGMDSSIVACRESLDELARLLSEPTGFSHATGENSSLRGRARDLGTQLAWPLKRTRVLGALDSLAQSKASLSLMVSGEIV